MPEGPPTNKRGRDGHERERKSTAATGRWGKREGGEDGDGEGGKGEGLPPVSTS